jgi:hypothetical protein
MGASMIQGNDTSSGFPPEFVAFPLILQDFPMGKTSVAFPKCYWTWERGKITIPMRKSQF